MGFVGMIEEPVVIAQILRHRGACGPRFSVVRFGSNSVIYAEQPQAARLH